LKQPSKQDYLDYFLETEYGYRLGIGVIIASSLIVVILGTLGINKITKHHIEKEKTIQIMVCLSIEDSKLKEKLCRGM